MSTNEIPSSLAGIVLSDSYVLDVTLKRGTVMFDCDFMLDPRHASYEPASPTKRGCFKRGRMTFEGVASVTWTGQLDFVPAIDADEEVDYGNIDAFSAADHGYELEGDWGQMLIIATDVSIALDD